MKVIPAVDVIGGRLVRLSEGDYSRRSGYGLSPLEAARRFEDGGLSSLHLVDLDGARGSGSNLSVLEEIASHTSLTIDFGGGIRTEEGMRRAFDAGAAKVNIGSLAAKDRARVLEWGRKYPGRIILSADARNGKVAVSGWTEDTELELIPFLSGYLSGGIGSAVVTDIARDGMLSGPSLELYRKIMSALPELRLTASGGVSSKEDLAALSSAGCYGVIVGKAFYEGRISIEEMKEAECLQRG